MKFKYVLISFFIYSSLQATPKPYDTEGLELSVYGNYNKVGGMLGQTDIVPLYAEQEILKSYNNALTESPAYPLSALWAIYDTPYELWQKEKRDFWGSLYPAPLNYPLLLDSVDSLDEINTVYGEPVVSSLVSGGLNLRYPLEFRKYHLYIMQSVDYRRTKLGFNRSAFLREPDRGQFDLEDMSYRIEAYKDIHPKFYLMSDLSVNAGLQRASSLAGRLYPEGSLGFVYRMSPSLELGTGSLYSYIGGQGEFYPLLFLQASFSNRLSLDLYFPLHARLQYLLSETLTVQAGVSADGGVYTLKDDRNDLTYSSTQLELSLAYNPIDSLSIEIKPAYLLSQSYTFYYQGEQIQEYAGTGAVALSMSISYQF